MSELLAQRAPEALPFELLSFALEPGDRAVLHERIARRFDLMLEDDALLDEVEALRRRGDLHPGLPSMRCVGYRQAWEYLDGRIDYKTLRETGIIATRQLAKRQLTWLRSMPDRIVIDCLAPDATAQMLAHLEAVRAP
jgi:tRNA dimethylallyltransferase